MPDIPAESPLTIAAHPVTRVYCNDEALVCYERDGADIIRLNEVSPERSRSEARRRCKSLLDFLFRGGIVDLSSLAMHEPISTSKTGLSYRQLAEQTTVAIAQSKAKEAEREAMFAAKRKRR